MPYLSLSEIDIQEFTPRRFPFEIKDIIKSAIPSHKRVWDSQDKVWLIHNECIELADKLIHRHTAKDKETGLDWQSAWHVLYLRESSPLDIVDAVADVLVNKMDSPLWKGRIEAARHICKEW